jgi:hypothetical protein
MQLVILAWFRCKSYHCFASISLCHGCWYDRWVYKVRENNHLVCLEYYWVGIIECFGAEFIRRPTITDTQHLLAKVEPIYMGDIKHLIIILEAIASYNRWIWHFFFWVAGSNNDINVLNQSPLFIDVIRGHTPEVCFTVNGHEHHMRYCNTLIFRRKKLKLAKLMHFT